MSGREMLVVKVAIKVPPAPAAPSRYIMTWSLPAWSASTTQPLENEQVAESIEPTGQDESGGLVAEQPHEPLMVPELVIPQMLAAELHDEPVGGLQAGVGVGVGVGGGVRVIPTLLEFFPYDEPSFQYHVQLPLAVYEP